MCGFLVLYQVALALIHRLPTAVIASEAIQSLLV